MSRPRRDTLTVDVPPIPLVPTASPPLPASSASPLSPSSPSLSPLSPLNSPSPIITATPAGDANSPTAPSPRGHSRTDSLAASLASHAASTSAASAGHSRSTSISSYHSSTSRPGSISLPPTPTLIPDAATRDFSTNSLALILPHPSLFLPEALALLRRHFERYGGLTHFAPIRAMGRVILVYDNVENARKIKEADDFLKLDVEASPNPVEGTADSGGYFDRTKKGLTLRLYALPPQKPSEPAHLQVPEHERNFLISPPGSPPEGWEPIEEDGPNETPLAEDLRRALEALQFAGSGPNVILDEGGVTVSVEDTDAVEKPRWDADREWGDEEPDAGPGIWDLPGQTPAGKVRIVPTAMPPMGGK